MAKNQRRDNNNTRRDAEYERTDKDYDPYLEETRRRSGDAYSRSTEAYDRARSGYEGLIPQYRRLGGEGRALGASAAGRFNRLGDENAAWARNSISDEDKAVYNDQIASSVPRFYQNMKDEFDRTNMVQGGVNAGYSSQTAKLARDAARGQVSAVREGKLSLHDAINKGRQWGTEGASASESNLQGLLSRNYLGGMGLAGENYGRGFGADSWGMGFERGTLQDEGNIYSQIRGMGENAGRESQGYNSQYGDTLRDKYGVRSGIRQEDDAANPRKKAWWEYALDIGTQLGAAALGGRSSHNPTDDPSKRNPVDEGPMKEDNPAGVGYRRGSGSVTSRRRTSPYDERYGGGMW